MAELWMRSWSVQIGTMRVRSTGARQPFAIQLEVDKTLDREPNTAAVRVANLSSDQREEVQGADAPQLELRAGYTELEDTIFVGDVRDAWTERDGADLWLVVEAEDGGSSYRTARISRSWEHGVQLATVIAGCADAMGVGRGNSATVAASAELDSGGSTFLGGYTADGVAWRELDAVCRSSGLRWSVQSGVLQLRRVGQPAERRAVRLAPGTGLTGSPTPSRGSGDDAAGVRATALLMPGLYPGRVVQLDSDTVSGTYLCSAVSYRGESRGAEWKADLELEEY